MSFCLRVSFFLVFILSASVVFGEDLEPASDEIDTIPMGIINDNLVGIGYSGNEKLSYDVSYTGGIKIGELHLQISTLSGRDDTYKIEAFVTTQNGMFSLLYPINDRHVTLVQGHEKLPYQSEIWQKEGYSYTSHKLIEYDQKNGVVRHIKNGKVDHEYIVDGKVNNEFSSFFNSRLMPFKIGEKFIVPTFADKRRVLVIVDTVKKVDFKKTLLGHVRTVEIMPIMTFKGLYDKKGDTVIWYTDDECRVPVRINSKILIGSLTAELTHYENSACKRYLNSKTN